ncbi:MAG: hypothetical protein H0U39_12290 [Segetibacter sp.]|nr:hypothetical protein [Segetibacter sp.]
MELHRVKELQPAPCHPVRRLRFISLFIIETLLLVSFAILKVLISIVVVEVCDATDDAMSIAAGYKNQHSNLKN